MSSGQSDQELFLPTSDVFSTDEKQFLNQLTTIYSNIAKLVNCREIALYENTEMATGQSFYDPTNLQNRNFTYRKTFFFGAIASGATLNIAHGITGQTIFTHIGGGIVDSTPYYKPLPYANIANLGLQVDIKIDAANIIIINGVIMVDIVIMIHPWEK